MPSTAIAAATPTSRRAALRTAMKPSPDCALHFLFLLAPITWGPPTDVKRIGYASFGRGRPFKHTNACNSGLAREMRFDKGRDKARHRGVEIAQPPHQMDRRELGRRLQDEIGLDPGTQR